MQTSSSCYLKVAFMWDEVMCSTSLGIFCQSNPLHQTSQCCLGGLKLRKCLSFTNANWFVPGLHLYKMVWFIFQSGCPLWLCIDTAYAKLLSLLCMHEHGSPWSLYLCCSCCWMHVCSFQAAQDERGVVHPSSEFCSWVSPQEQCVGVTCDTSEWPRKSDSTVSSCQQS